MKRNNMSRTCKVIKSYASTYPDPIKVKKGDILKVGNKESDWNGWTWCTDQNGKSGWLPDSYIKKDGSNCTVLCDYEATELTVNIGEELIVEKEESGWLWCINKEGLRGWIPSENVKF